MVASRVPGRKERPVGESWSMTIGYVVALAAFAFPAKLASALLSGAAPRERLEFLLLSPFFSLTTWRARQPFAPRPALRLLARGLAAIAATAAFYRWGRLDLSRSAWLAGYGAIVPLYVLSESLAAAFRIAYLPVGILPPIHDRPWAATGVADFWGRR